MSNSEATATLRVGAAEVDITPAMGTQIAGSIGIHRPAELVVDPIFAKALVLESGATKLCYLSLDLLSVTNDYSDEIRDRAAEMIGTNRNAVMLHATQNHAAPSLGHLMCDKDNDVYVGEWRFLRGGDDAYHPVVVERTLEAVREANKALRPVRLGVGRGMDGRVAFNRRFVYRDGHAEMGVKGGLENILHREGPSDPEVGVACFQTDDLKPVALLLHHTCHPVHGYPKRYITAGWPGACCAEMRAAAGEQCIPLVANGCCGNVAHANPFDPAFHSSPETMGGLLAETASKVLPELHYTSDVELDFVARRVPIPYRDIPADRLAQAKRTLEETPTPPPSKTRGPRFVSWDWIYDVAILDIERLKNRTPCYDYEIQAFRIGDMALVALTGEPFVEGQLEIKLNSPFAYTFIAHMSNGYIGYIPTTQALERGGYETRLGWGSKLAPDALATIVRETPAILEELIDTDSHDG